MSGPNPNEVLNVLRKLSGIFIMGNHDREALRKMYPRTAKGMRKRILGQVRECRKYIAERRYHQHRHNPDRQWTQWTRRQISWPNYLFMTGFSQTASLERGARKIRLIHGEIPRAWGYGTRIWPDSPEELFERLAARYEEDYILFGHSHVQFQKVYEHKTFISVGSVGQPRLGKPVAAYTVLNDDGFSLRSVPYNTAATAASMDLIGLQDQDFVEEWKECFRTATLPTRYNVRDFDSLKDTYL